MNIVLDGIINGVANDVECINGLREHYVVFCYPVALIAAFSALTALTDAMGRSPDIVCSFYVFHRSKGSAAAKIVHKSNFHSPRMSFINVMQVWIFYAIYLFSRNHFVSIWG